MHKILKNQTKKSVRCASYRDDGQLLAVGGDDMKVDIINVTNRTILRQAKGHEGAINDIQFIPNKTEVASCSDDKTIKIWDIPTEAAVSTLKFHTDYVRAVRFHSQSNLLVAGSYDHTISLWDVRSSTSSPVSSYKHANPVESLEFFPSSTTIACAGSFSFSLPSFSFLLSFSFSYSSKKEGNGVSMWDIVSGKVITRLANHQKTVTKICFEGSGTWFASSSLDHQVKVYDLSNYQVVNSFKYTAPILTFAISVRFYILNFLSYFNLLIPSPLSPVPSPLSSVPSPLSSLLLFPFSPFSRKIIRTW